MNAPSRIGPYDLIEEIGRGAMGVVFRGFDPAIGRAVAIKIIRSDPFAPSLDREEARRRFAREAGAAGKLSHPGIVTVFHLGNEGEHQYLVMELVAGQSLEKLLVSGTPAGIPNALQMLRQLAGALDYAHSHDVIHRDIKPANIMVSPDGMVKIADFGIARILSGTLTLTGAILGTPAYMAPEQIMARKVGARADQFSLAVVAYQILTGHRPFEASSTTEMMHQILYTEPEPAHIVNPLLPVAANDVFQRALSKDPEQRYGTCTEFVTEMERVLVDSRLPECVVARAKPQAEGENHTNAAPAGKSPFVPAGRPAWLKRHRSLVSAAVGVCLAVLALALFLVRTRTPAKRASLESAATKEASALAMPPSGPPIAAERYPVPALTKRPIAEASHPSGSSSPAPGVPPAFSGSVTFKATNADSDFRWAVTAEISGTVAYEGHFLRIMVSSCILSRPTTFTSPEDIVAIGASVTRLTDENGTWKVQRGTDIPYSIRQALPPGQKIKLPPFTLNIPIDNFEVKVGDWLTFSVIFKGINDGKETLSYVPLHWRSLAPPPAGLASGPATVQQESEDAPTVKTVAAASTTPPADPPPTANVRAAEVKHATGLQLLDQNKVTEAIAVFTEVINLNPRFADAYFDRCRAYIRVPLRDRAVEDCSRAIELKPAYAEAYLWRGHANYQGRPDEALKDFTEAIRLNPESEEAYMARGNFYFNFPRKRFDLAIQDFTEAIRVKPTDYFAYFMRGAQFANQKDYARAIQDYDESIRLRPWASTYNLRGDACRMQQQYERAIKDYDEAIRLSPNTPNTFQFYEGRAAAKDSIGDKTGAVADRQRAIELKSVTKAQPSTVPSWATDSSPSVDARVAEVKHAQGLQMLNQQKYAEAIATFTEAIRLKPDFAEAYLNRCRAYGSLTLPSMISHSIEDCGKAIQLKPDFGEAYHYRGRAYAAKQLFQQAIQDYDEALRLEPGSSSIYTDRGFLYAAQNKPDLAIKEYDELIRIKPKDSYAYFARAREYNRQHRPELALPDCNESIRLDSRIFYAYGARGDAHRLQGQYDLAVQDYDEAIRLQPNYAEFYIGRAAAKASLGDKAGAAADQKRAQELRK